MSDVYATWHHALGHRQYRITITMTGHGSDADAGEQFLEGFLSKHPENGPVVSQDATTDTISVTFTVNARDEKHAIDLAEVIFASGGIASGVPAGDLFRLEIESVDKDRSGDSAPERQEPLPA